MRPIILSIIDKIDSNKVKGYKTVNLGSNDFNYYELCMGRNSILPEDIVKEEIQNSNFYCNINLINTINYAKSNKSKIHIIGNYSEDKNILNAIIKTSKDLGMRQVYLHLFSNRKINIDNLNKEISIGKLCNIINPNVLVKEPINVYNALVKGKKNKASENLNKACISSNDVVIFYNVDINNFIDLISSFVDEKFDKFNRKELNNLKVMTIFSYDKLDAMYKLSKSTFSETLSNNNIKELRCNFNNYVFDGYQKKKNKNIKISSNIFDEDISKYDIIFTENVNSEIDKLKDLASKNDAVLLVIGKINGNLKLISSMNYKMQDGNLLNVEATILDMLKLKIPKDINQSLIIHKNVICGFVFRFISVIFVLICIAYYMARFLYFYLMK